jgi:hypothetical protein
VSTAGQQRVDLFGAYRELGIHRVQTFVRSFADGPDALESFAADVRAAGASLQPAI